MKKINLHKIMEALDTQTPEELQADLHEWFVDQAKKVAQPVKEGMDPAIKSEVKHVITTLDEDNVYDAIIPAYEDAVGQRAKGYGYSSVDWESIPFDLEYDGPLREQVIDYLEYQIMEAIEADIADHELLNYLMAGREITENGVDDGDDEGDETNLLGRQPDDMDEARVDELSTDTMMNYAKKARKDRDRPSADDEKVGRRVAGLDMVARKARREKAAPKYEAAPPVFDPEQNDDAKTSAWNVKHEGSNPIKPERYDMLLSEIKHGLKFGKDRDNQLDVDLGDGRAMDFAWRVVSQDTHDVPGDVIIDGSEKAGNSPEEYIGAELIDLKGMNVALCYHEYPVEWLNETVVESEEEEDDAEQTNEAYDALVAELNEAFKGLETVSDKLQNVEGAQVGEQGKVPVNKKSTLPSKKGDKRVGGEPVEIKSNGHKGHALEKAPKVKDAPVKGTIQNDKDDPKKVADKGDKSALLNKVDGPINTQSPISGKGAKGLKK